MRKPEVRIVQQQSEEVSSERQLTEEETKEFLYKNHPDLYKKLYPDQVIEKPKKKENLGPKPHQKREGNDIQKSDKVYVHNRYGSAEIAQGADFSYKIQIKTDMDINT